MTPDDELTRDRERRLVNQRAFPRLFVSCHASRGVVCAPTRASSRGRRPSSSATANPLRPLPLSAKGANAVISTHARPGWSFPCAATDVPARRMALAPMGIQHSGETRARASSNSALPQRVAPTAALASRRQRWCSTSIRSAAHARPHCAYARDATRPAKWRFRGSSPSEHLVGTALGRPHS
jgi:hypothetical protein